MKKLFFCLVLVSSFIVQACGQPEKPAVKVEVGIAKVYLLANGDIHLNGQPISIDSLQEKLDAMPQLKQLWYSKESGETHDNFAIIFDIAIAKNLGISFYEDKEFKRAVNLSDLKR